MIYSYIGSWIVAYSSEEIIRRLRESREASGVSQRTLSARSGLTQSHISQIETGTLEPGLASFLQLARALDLELMLVPRKLVPAVQGILQGTHSEKTLSPVRGGAALRDIERGERLVKKQKILYGSSIELERIAEYLRFLRYAPLTTRDLFDIREVIEALRRSQESERSSETLKKIADILRTMRNRHAHPVIEKPRPAYALDDGDDDA